MDMTNIESHMRLLGFKAKDKVTGFEGTVECVSFDLYGCVQVVLKPKAEKGEKYPQGTWFDVSRLEITNPKRVMDMPNFERGRIAEGRKGASEKPSKECPY